MRAEGFGAENPPQLVDQPGLEGLETTEEPLTHLDFQGGDHHL